MSETFRNKYRVPSARAQWWDYGKNGAYFVTICTRNRVPYLGSVGKGNVLLTAVGNIVEDMWKKIINHAKNVKLGEFVVMPNHIHGIMIINKDCGDGIDGADIVGAGVNAGANVETRHALSLQRQPQQQSPGKSRFRDSGKNTISSIIGGYKSAVTRQCNIMGVDFAWQSRFHDHIIRDDAEYSRIAEYIVNNPLTWEEDKFWVG